MRPLLLAFGLAVAGAASAQQAEPQQAGAPVYSVAEPKPPLKAKPAARKRAAKANAGAKAAPPSPVVADAEVLKPSGPCVIKPVMSDQDLVNCGARVRH